MRTGTAVRRVDRGWWVTVLGGGAVLTILAVGWWRLLFLPLGASHDGRINARFGLHVRNLLESGLPGSDYLASMAPFSELPYVHHPPLLNLLHALVGAVLGQGEWQLHLIGYIAGLATVAGLLWLARELGLGATGAVLALALVAGTPMFWIYARLGLGVSLMLVLLVLWVRHHRASDAELSPVPGGDGGSGTGPSATLLATMAGVTAFSGWTGALLVAALVAWGLRYPGLRRVCWSAGAAGAAAVAVTLAWAVTIGDVTELAAHASDRRQWPPWDALVENYVWFYGTLFSGWFRWLIVPAIVMAVVDRRTRMASVVVMVALAVWTLANPDAAYLHDYWTYPLLVPVFLGMAAILDRLGCDVPGITPRSGWEGARLLMVAVLVLVAVLGFRGLGPYRQAYFEVTSDAGRLIKAVGPGPAQEVAWVAEGVDPLPYWASYYWDLPVTEVPLDGGGLRSARDTDLVLARSDRLPERIRLEVEPVAEHGRYALFTAASLRLPL